MMKAHVGIMRKKLKIKRKFSLVKHQVVGSLACWDVSPGVDSSFGRVLCSLSLYGRQGSLGYIFVGRIMAAGFLYNTSSLYRIKCHAGLEKWRQKEMTKKQDP